MRHQHGFTMIEVLLAAAVLIGSCIAILDGWTQSADATQLARQGVAAANLAMSQLEYTSTRPFTEPAPTPSPVTIAASSRGNQASTVYTLATTKTPVSGTSDQMDINVVVSWQQKGVTHSVSLETIVFAGS